MVNIRVATFLYPPYLNKDENGQPSGIKLFRRLIDLVRGMTERKGINLTAVFSEGRNFGKYENGTYDGLLGLIYNDEADTAVMPCPLETDPPPGKFGPVMYSTEVHIYTIVNPSAWQSVDFLSCLNVFDTTINALIMIALIAIGFLLVKHYKHRTVFVLLSNALEQSFSTVQGLGFLPHLSMLMGILLVQALHSGLYSTNSWVEIGPKPVDTLHDLVTQGKKPMFHAGTPAYHMFKNGFSKDAKKVWERAKRVGLSKCLINNDQLIQVVSERKLSSDTAFVFFDYFEAFATVLVCQIDGKSFEEKGLRFHASKSVHSGLMAGVRNPRLKDSDAQHLDESFYNLFEFGYIQNFMEEMKRDPPMVGGVASLKCRRELFKAKALNENGSEIKLTLSDVGHALTLFFVILIVLSALFTIGLLRRY